MSTDRKDRFPWFRFYPDRWLLDCTEEKFDLATEGLYMRLLSYQWRRGIIPAGPFDENYKVDKNSTLSREDLEKISTLCRLRVDFFSRLWNLSLYKKFVQVEGGLVNMRLEEERQGRVAFGVMAGARGRKGGEISSRRGERKSNNKSTKEDKDKDKDKDKSKRSAFNQKLDIRIVELMAEAVRFISSNGFPDFDKNPGLRTRWINQARQLREIDGRDPKVTASLLAGLRSGEFKGAKDFDWANQIKHPGKFRAKNSAGETYWEVLVNERNNKTRTTGTKRGKRNLEGSKFETLRTGRGSQQSEKGKS